mgnify:FL=1
MGVETMLKLDGEEWDDAELLLQLLLGVGDAMVANSQVGEENYG